MADTLTHAGTATPPRRRGFVLSYVLLVAVPLVAAAVLLRIGATLPAPAHPAVAVPVPAEGVLRLPLLIAQILVILVASRLVASVLKRFGQPSVIGEMIAGLLLGSSVLGALAPDAYQLVFPRGTLRFLRALSDIGVLLFMFTVGLELDHGLLRRRGRTALLTSHASIAVPLFLAVALAFALYPRFGVANGRFVPFALFLGCAMALTAFPVLARILSDRGLQRTEVGTVALASAAVDDVTAWCLLAFVTAMARGGAGRLPPWGTLAGLVAHAAIMLLVVRPRLHAWSERFIARDGAIRDLVAVAVMLTLASAWITEVIGVHALFGAFLAGVVMPRDARIGHVLRQRFEDVMLVLLLPLFFAFTGLRTNVRLLDSPAAWGLCAAVIGVAVLGKLGASTAAARVSGLAWRDAAVVGALMNTRGMMELIILNVGLDLGILTPPLFAILVLMAIVTTLMTSPLVDRLERGRERG